MITRTKVPLHIQRGVWALLILLMGISVARLFTRIHQLEERVEQLEESEIAQDTRLNRMQDALQQQAYGGGQLQYQSNHRVRYQNNNRYEGRRYGYATNDTLDTRQRSMTERSSESEYTPKSNYTSLTRETTTTRSNKYTEPRRFNLNNIDSITLVRIPGIAARTASIILRQRQLYGGFYDPWQLQDFLTWEAAVAHLDEWCTQWFSADVADITHLSINKATVAELRHHPYITYEQAIEIVKYRTRHKKIEKLEELYNFSTFQPEEIKRLAFYLSFE